MADRKSHLPVERVSSAVAGSEAPVVQRRGEQGSKRLQVEPIAVLLPRIGSIHGLRDMRDELLEQLRLLQTQKSNSSEYDVRAQAAEESMLQQALQWLAAGQGD